VVSIIIINYNTFSITNACIQSIYEHTNDIDFEIILVDNASTETDPEKFKEIFPEITLVKSAVNTGFSKGNNLGIARANGEFLLLLNSDTYLIEDSISKAVKHMAGLARAGALGVRMKFPDGKIQYTARHFKSISWELLDLFRFIPFLLPYRTRAKLMLGKYFKADFNCNCDWVNGAFFLFPKVLLDNLPGRQLDDRFFMYGEDQLWCWQFEKMGYTNYFLSETSIVHINNASTKFEKRILLLKTMYQRELAIMKERKGTGAYYYFFKLIYGSKEWIRIIVKSTMLRLTGKVIR
jgi:GT2 family glycosyltransferase